MERDLGYKCTIFLKSGLVSLSTIDGIAQAENNHRQFTAGVDVDFHPAVPCVTVKKNNSKFPKKKIQST